MTTLISKIAKASAKVGALATDKVNAQQNYNYISADKVLDRAGAALAEVGVVIIPSVTGEETERLESTDSYGKVKVRYDATVRFAMTISDGESQYDVPWCGRGSDYAVPDKALYKAITSGHKYFLMKLLNIGVGNEDGEHENPEPDTTKTPQNGRSTPTTSYPTAGAAKTQQRPATQPTAQPSSVTVDGATAVSQDGPGGNPFDDKAQPEPMVDDATLKRLHALGTAVYGSEWDGKRHELIEKITQGRTHSSKDLALAEARRMCAGIEAKLAQMQQPDAKARKAQVAA